jgi:hypothetical protein
MRRRDILDLQVALGEFSPQRSERFRYQVLMCLDSVEDRAIGIYPFEIVDNLANRWSGSSEIKPGRRRQSVPPGRTEADHEVVVGWKAPLAHKLPVVALDQFNPLVEQR